MTQNYEVDRDLREASAMTDALESYLRQSALYGSVSGGFLSLSNMPSLTVGALVMRLRRLDVLSEAGQLDSTQRDRLRAISREHDRIYAENRQRYAAKLRREVESRLKAARQFFDECHADPKACARNYPPEVNRRTIAQEALIRMEALNIAPDDDLKALIRRTDNHLRRAANQDADFLWSAALAPAYPQNVFWWLYRQPYKPED